MNISNLKALLFGLLFSVLLIVGFIFTVRPPGPLHPKMKDEYLGGRWVDVKKPFMDRMIPGKTVTNRKLMGEKLLFEVTYTFDDYGRRQVKDNEAINNNFIALMGGSYTFGYGLNYPDTLPAIVKKRLPKWNVYNYSQSAAGTNDILDLIRGGRLGNELNEKTGYGIYAFIDDHLNRLMGDSNWMRYRPSMSFYELEEEEVVFRGTFEEASPLRTKFYRWFAFSWLSSKFNLRLPLWDFESDFHLLCKSIDKMRDEFNKQLPSAEFIVLFHPDLGVGETPMRRYLKKCLKEEGIRMVHAQADFDKVKNTGPFFVHPKDPHPNRLYNGAVADALVRFIEQSKP